MRIASDVLEISESSIVVQIPDSTGTNVEFVKYGANSYSGTLTRTIGSETLVLLENLANFQLLFFDYMGRPTAAIGDVKMVQMFAEVVIDNPSLDLTKKIISSRIMMRSRIVSN